MSNAARLRDIIESIERSKEAIAEYQAMIREQKEAAKDLGYSVKVLNLVLKRRVMTTSERDELDALVNLYEAQLGMLNGTPLGEAARRRLERMSHPPEDDLEDISGDDVAAPPAEEQQPQDTEDEARVKGHNAALDGLPITSNPYSPRSVQRAAWDEGWCGAMGSDGMDIPDAWKPTAKPKKPKKGKGDDDAAPDGGTGDEGRGGDDGDDQ